MQEAVRRGLDPANLTEAQYAMCSVAIRSREELVEDGKRAVASIARTKVFGLKVLPEKREANKAQCEKNECQKFRSINGKPACDWCNCQGVGLESKWEDPFEFCPGGYWSNLT